MRIRTRGFSDRPTVSIPLTPPRLNSWPLQPPLFPPPDGPGSGWPPVGDWPPNLCDHGECWYDFTERFMRLVYTIGEYRLSLGQHSLIPWWDLRDCLYADPDIVNTAIKWLVNMWNTIPSFDTKGSDGGKGTETKSYAINKSSKLLTAHAKAPYKAFDIYREATAINTQKLRYNSGGRVIITARPGFILTDGRTSRPYHSLKVHISNRAGTMSQDIPLEMRYMSQWYKFDCLILDEVDYSIYRNGVYYTGGSLVNGGGGYTEITYSVKARAWNEFYLLPVPEVTAMMWVDAVIAPSGNSYTLDDKISLIPVEETSYKSDSDYPLLEADTNVQTDSSIFYPSPLTMTMLPTEDEGGEASFFSLERIYDFHMNDLSQCPQAKAWLFGVERTLYAQMNR